MSENTDGMFCLVLHSHLPWLAHHGRWPVGEEWLYQSWADSYLPLARMLRRFAEEGVRGALTLGVTPVLAAQLDDPYCLDAMHHWLGNWQLRAHEAALMGAGGTTATTGPALRALGEREHQAASTALADFEANWRHGAAPMLRQLAEAGAVELLGGPLTHPFQPLLHPRLRAFALAEGLADAQQRFGIRPRGIWAPECAYRPGMEDGYTAAGVGHFLVDGPSLHGDTSLARPVGASDVLAFGRDLQVSYRVWSPRSGYPGHPAYRDFHTYHHATGLKPARVTSRTTATEDKAPYDPARAQTAIAKHVKDFVGTVKARLRSESARIGRPALVVAAFDTELFGHWWHEGPLWLEQVLRALPEAGVRVGTLSDAAAEGYVGAPVDLPESSWGSGKDWRVWAGPLVSDLVDLNAEVVDTALDTVDKRMAETRGTRDRVSDQLLREALLCTASDWAFMVSKDSAVHYARGQAHKHAHALREIAAAAASGRESTAAALADGWNVADGLFPGLDARRLPGAFQ